MPRALPPLADELSQQISYAENFVVRLESAAIHLRQIGVASPTINVPALELAYELAYLRVFVAWESFLEQVFIRLLCGYTHSRGQEPLVANVAYEKTIEDATRQLLGNRDFLLWHNPTQVVQRAQRFFANGQFELVVASSAARVDGFSAIRHRIVHSQEHAKTRFDAVTMRLSARRYRGGRPGRFLRDWVSGQVPQTRWLSFISNELLSLARQI